MSDHLSTQLLERYDRRRLEAAELLALDDHLTGCAACRERLRQMKSGDVALLALRASVQTAEGPASNHLPHEQLMTYAAGRLDEVDSELAESHLDICPPCAAHVKELRDLAAQQDVVVDTSFRSVDGRVLPPASRTGMVSALSLSSLRERILPVSLTLRVAGAVAMIALLVIAVALWVRTQKDGQELVDRHPTPLPSPSQPSVNPSPVQQQATAAAAILLALNDGSGKITLDGQGNFTGLETFSPADQQRVKSAIETRKVQTPKTLRELRDSSSSIMGGSSGTVFALLNPVGKITAAHRPTLRWRSLDGAISYQVTITDPASGYQAVAASPELKGTSWTVDRALKRGRVYNWQVTARTAGGEVKAPAPNAPEAKFKVLEQATADALVKAKKDYTGRRLVLGLLYAEAGLLDEAEREFRALVAANSQSPFVRDLLRDVRFKRRRR